MALKRIILIGGFGDSDYLHARLRNWCANNGKMQLLVPDHPYSYTYNINADEANLSFSDKPPSFEAL